MTGIFKSNNPSGNAILFAYALAVKWPMFLHVHAPQLQPQDGVLYKWFLHLLTPLAANFSFTYNVIAFLLLFIQAVSLNRTVNKQRLLRYPNYLTGMSYLLITSMFTDLFSLSASLIVNTFMIWIFSKLCALYNNPNPKSTIFNIGLITGLITFFYFPSIAFLVTVMAGIAIARPFRLQEWLIGLIGIITPVYFFGSWLFLTGTVKSFHFPGVSFSYPHFSGNTGAYAAIILIALAILTGIYFININISRQVVQTRKSWQLLFLYLVVAVIVPFINAGSGFSYWVLAAVPLSPLIAAAFFYPQKKMIPLLLHWLMFAVYLYVSFFAK